MLSVYYYAARGSLPNDVSDMHVHLEEIDPATGEVIRNVHLRWPAGAGR
jgi:hypothetical protein